MCYRLLLFFRKASAASRSAGVSKPLNRRGSSKHTWRATTSRRERKSARTFPAFPKRGIPATPLPSALRQLCAFATAHRPYTSHLGRPKGRIPHEISSCMCLNCGPSFDVQSRFRETPAARRSRRTSSRSRRRTPAPLSRIERPCHSILHR